MNPTIASIVETDIIAHDPTGRVDLGILKKVKVEVLLKDTPCAVSNAIVRSMNEMLNYALHCDYDKIETDDINMNKTVLEKNISLIPLRSIITEEEARRIHFTLDVKNDDGGILPITMGDLIRKGPEPKIPMFFPNIVLVYLNPGCSLRISEPGIRFVEGYGHHHPKFDHIQNVVSFPVDYEKSTLVTSFMEQIIRFNINHVPPKEKNMSKILMQKGIESLIERLTLIMSKSSDESNLLHLKKFEDHIEFEIEETYTIATLIGVIATKLFPKIKFIASEVKIQVNKMYVHIYDGSNSLKIFQQTVAKCIEILERISNQLN